MELKAGSRFQSRVCPTQVIVVKATEADLPLTCGGVPMVAAGSDYEPAEAASGLAEGTAIGKRYVDASAAIELLCTKPGSGTLGIGDTALEMKEAKPLPASD